MGTGVGEAMLLGAVTGAGTSAITGNDPIKGAMFGAMGGAIMPGVGSALGGAPAGTVGSTAAGATASAVPGATQSAFQSALPEVLGTAGSSAVPETARAGITEALGASSNVAPAASQTFTPKTGLMDVFRGAGDSDTRQIGQRIGDFITQNPMQAAMLGGGAANTLFNQLRSKGPEEDDYDSPLKRFRYDPRFYRPAYASGGPITGTDPGIAGTEKGMYPQSQFPKVQYAVPSQMPTSAEVVEAGYEPRVNPLTGEPSYASGGIADLGSYSDGGRLLKGPGDGMSDDIPARIGRRQPARLADGEFVVPADVVSGLGNGSTDAGAKQLYAMMDRVRRDRTGTKKQGKQIKPRKYMPA
jgi:hypothetical protein